MHEDEVLFTEFFNQKLKERGFTLKQLSEQTGIAMKYLESFSHGRFEHLPSSPYVHGYFVRLGSIMGFDPDEWWNRVKNEDTVHKSGPSDRMPGNRYNKGRGRVIIWGSVVVVAAIIYIGARLTTILGEPRIILLAPDSAVNHVSQSTMLFEGRVENGNILTIDNNSVPILADGSFSAEIMLAPNRNVIEIKAKKTLGREVTLTREIYYDATQVIIEGSSGAASGTIEVAPAL